jgi:hypothetical protein
MYGVPYVSQETQQLLPEQLQLTDLYNRDTFSLQFQTSAFKQFIRYIPELFSSFYIHRVKVSITREYDPLTLNGASLKITPHNETRRFALNTFLFNYLDIQTYVYYAQTHAGACLCF